ncbi:unnamed protein product [Lota lota]
MPVQSVPLGSVTIGPPAWRESAERSVRQAERLVRQTRVGQSSTTTRPRTGATTACYPKHANTEDKTMKHRETTEDNSYDTDQADSHGVSCNISRPQTTGTTFPCASKSPTLAPFQAASLRERCARQSTAAAGEYMRWVREVELRLRRQAGRASRERAKLGRECAHLEMMLRSLRSDLQVNRESTDLRTEGRPQQDGADLMLAWEKRELAKLKHDVEETLRKTQRQLQVLDGSSRDLQVWSSQQALVLDLLPHRGSVPAPHPPSAATRTPPPTYGFTSESEQVLDSSSLAVNQSQRLREQIRHMLSEVVTRQQASQHVVNGGLVKKVAETVTLERSLALTAAATRHAASRKQREVDSIRLSYGRAQGPESSGDVFCRERLGRPVVQVFQRHPGTQLPEATHLLKGSAVLGYRLSESEDDAARLRRCFLQLRGEARGKYAAARRDTTVVRMRLQRGDKRAIPHILQQGEPKVRDLLLPVAPMADSPAAALEPRGIYTRCDGDKMGVQVPKSVLGSGGSASHLSLARWERLSPWDHYVLGKPMFFEVEARSLAPDRRLYIQNCHATLGPSATSTPSLTIMDNFGCMVKQVGRSRFIPSRNNRVRFTVDAFLLEATGQPLYMHCSMSTADSTVTPTAKACNYDSASARWKEVSGLESVCSCCETSCSSAPSSDTTVVRSRSWTVERKGKPSAHPKRKIDMTAATTMTPTTVRMMTKFKTSQQEATAVSPVDLDAPEWEWPVKVLRGSDVDGKVLKGSGGVEVVRGLETVRKGSEGFLNVFSGVKDAVKGSGVDGKVMKGSEGVEVLEGFGVGKHVEGLAVEPRRIFEHFFGLDK